jgi:hypothetical protein
LTSAFLPVIATVTGAQADGTFAQIDISETTTTGVFTTNMGRLSFGITGVDFEGGSRQGLNILYELPLSWEIATVKLGPSYGRVKLDPDANAQTKFGAKVVLDRYIRTSFGSVYLLAEMNSVDNAAFVLGQMGLSAPGMSLEVSYGESDSYSETAFAVAKSIASGPVSIRGGYRFRAEEIFLGVSVNTF